MISVFFFFSWHFRLSYSSYTNFVLFNGEDTIFLRIVLFSQFIGNFNLVKIWTNTLGVIQI